MSNASSVDEPSSLVCASCGTGYDAGPREPWRCICGGPLELASIPAMPEDPPAPDALDPDGDRGLWAFAPYLPGERRVSLGEGMTPLVDASRWSASFKLEYTLPTGSFKDRGATTTLSRAAALGVERIVDDSSGNAGAALATYAARAGIDAAIYVPASVKPSKLAVIERVGGTAIRVDGGRDAVTDACVDAVAAGEGWYASHAWNPAFFVGTSTVAFEVARQRGWTAPDAFVTPVGHGTMLLGAARGFERLAEAGWIDRVPRIIGVQAGGYTPIAAAFGHGAAPNDLADGVQIVDPARETQLLEAIRESGGTAIALGSAPVEAALDTLHRDGFYVEPTSALAPAALEPLHDDGILSDDDEVVVPLTGSGLKVRW